MPIPFRPDSLDLETLHRLAKNLKKGFPEVFPTTDIALSQAQELIARALRYPDWHHAVHARPAPVVPTVDDPLRPDERPPAPALASVWDSPALRSLFVAQMLRGLEAWIPLPDQLGALVKALRTLDEPELAALLAQDEALLESRPDSDAWWKSVAARIAPQSPKVAMLVRIMVRGDDWPKGLRAIAQQCALEQPLGYYREERGATITALPEPGNDGASDDASPWSLAANRHMVFSALSLCLSQGIPIHQAFGYLRDDFRDNGHERLAHTMDPWADRGTWTGAVPDLARHLAPFSLESAVILLTGWSRTSFEEVVNEVEVQSAREMEHEERRAKAQASQEPSPGRRVKPIVRSARP